MSDLVKRLRTWVHAVRAVPVGDLLDEAADEIERLRKHSSTTLAAAAANLLERIDSSQRTLIFEQEAEIARLRLTDAEREAVLDAALAYESDPDEWECAKIAATLRGLLDRLGVTEPMTKRKRA